MLCVRHNKTEVLAQERELIALRAKGYLSREAYEEQHGEQIKHIRALEGEFERESRRRGGERYIATEAYSDDLAVSLDVCEIDGWTLTFKFKNGAEIKRVFNNDTNRVETWNRKLGRTK